MPKQSWLFNIIQYFFLILTGLVVKAFFLVNRTKIIRHQGGRFTWRRNTLVISNHQSMLDSFYQITALCSFKGIIPWCAWLIPWHAAAEENFFKNRWLTFICRLWKCLPIKKGRNHPEDLKKLLELLKRRNLSVFPEGGRTRDPNGKIGQGKAGVGYLIYHSGCQVVPVVLIGANKILPIGCYFPRFWHRLTIVIGRPIFFFPQNLPAKPSHDDYQKITDMYMSELEKLYRENAS